MSKAVVHHVTLYPLNIPLREDISFANLQYRESRPVVVAIEFQNGVVGFGEAVSFHRMNQEDVDEMTHFLESVYMPALQDFHPQSFGEALEVIEGLPYCNDANRLINSIRSAVELALLDATLPLYRRTMDDVVRWMGLPGFGQPGSIPHIRYSGVLAFDHLHTLIRKLRRMYWFGLRDFKFMIQEKDRRDHLERLFSYLKKSIIRGRCTLRLDLQGMWSFDRVCTWLSEMDGHPITCIEQPLPKGEEHLVSQLNKRFDRTWVLDESVVTLDDAKRLYEMGMAEAFTIQISRCGGLLPSLRIAAFARRVGVRILLGSVPGETSLLALAGLRFLEMCPGVIHAEGCQGTRLLCEDVTKNSLRFGYAGKPVVGKQPGVGLEISRHRLQLLSLDTPYQYVL